MIWFKHDSNAATDAKIKKLLIKYGAEGYAIYFHCLELIVSDISETNITFELEHDSEIIADDLKIRGTSKQSGQDRVNEIMKYIILLGLFEENQGRIYCYKVLKRLDSSMTSNVKMRKLIVNGRNSHDIVMTNHDIVMQEEKRRDKKEEKRIKSPAKQDNKIPFKEIIEFLNTTCKRDYKYTTQKTKDFITARYNEGFNMQDFKVVIKNKYDDWDNTDYSKFLRPSTLFGTKFESYLNQEKISDKRDGVSAAFQRLKERGIE